MRFARTEIKPGKWLLHDLDRYDPASVEGETDMRTRRRQARTPVPADQDTARRLRQARARRYGTIREACEAFGWNESTYTQHENGTNGFSNRSALTYSKDLKVNLHWLLSGEGDPDGGYAQINIVGKIGQFGAITREVASKMPAFAEKLAEAPPLADGELEAYTVEGDFNYPSLFNGDTVYTQRAGPPEAALGKQCIVTLSDGSRRLCLLARGATRGLFTVISLNASPLNDVPVKDAAPVVWVKRG